MSVRSADVTEHQEAVETIAREITRYLTAHPRAGDTVDGIRTWWLAGRRESSPTNVLRALEALVERGVVQRHALPDGTTIYSAAPPDRPGQGPGGG
jgi:Fe2+ or Zn2+ uptake regulation protein